MNKKYIRNQNVIDRLWYIEWLLMFKGWLSRSELTEKFGIQEAAATRDIRRYRDLADHNLRLNHSVKRYEINLDTFETTYPLRVETALSRLRSPETSQAMGYETTGIETIPRLHNPNIEVLAALSRAILNKESLFINYQSVENGTSTKEIAPHTMFDSGIKTYVRCFDFEKEKFIDLAINRISKTSQGKLLPDHASKNNDEMWNRIIQLELTVHPMVGKIRNKKTIEDDFQMTNGVRKVSVRAALAQYWLQRWNVDCSKDASLKDKIYQIHLRNNNVLDSVNGFFPGRS